MNLQNGYKVIYEKAANGKRTFYASKASVCNPDVDTQLGEFEDAEYRGKVIYEYKGSFYVTKGTTPAYDENGVPTDERLSAFDEVFVKATTSETEPEDTTNTETTVVEDETQKSDKGTDETPAEGDDETTSTPDDDEVNE